MRILSKGALPKDSSTVLDSEAAHGSHDFKKPSVMGNGKCSLARKVAWHGEKRRRREGEEKEKRRRREGEEKEKRRRREGEEKEKRRRREGEEKEKEKKVSVQ
ncbi:hypothetical protein GRJ2_001663400 [Grus japonensis]|uniref:Uncharacterized protein n=1 Tax=Grus japonensis TaxID=30415 RepID=A0ABC9X2S9_GRUJA